jgi:hypothetical protein
MFAEINKKRGGGLLGSLFNLSQTRPAVTSSQHAVAPLVQ